MVQLSQASTTGNSDHAAAAGGASELRAPSPTLVQNAERRSPSPIDRSTGISFIGYPSGGAGAHSLPRSYTSTTNDMERNTTITQVTVEHVRVPGMVITTTTKVQFDHPGHFLNVRANRDTTPAVGNPNPIDTGANPTPVATVVNTNDGGYPTDDETDSMAEDRSDDGTADGYDTETSMSDGSVIDAYMVPSPPAYRRPIEDEGPYYVIFAGREVGIVQGEWDAVVRPHCYGVPHARNARYESWDDALYQYARSYQDRRPFWDIRVLEASSPVIRDTSYRWSEGPAPGVRMLGVVDITGLDLDPSRVTRVART
ncbi:hypothetical protein V5O48_005373 [Marasmius crinis-equi]|uniref:Uncharacterized protein n=1 Tax=Marasmius crinis-equi TaxID=585013 RepID=A0ABR3FMY8_9AGAR